jgi:hypothetical protein
MKVTDALPHAVVTIFPKSADNNGLSLSFGYVGNNISKEGAGLLKYMNYKSYFSSYFYKFHKNLNLKKFLNEG